MNSTKTLTLGNDRFGLPVLPTKLRELEDMRKRELQEREERARVRAENAEYRARRREERRQHAERAEIMRKEKEDRAYQREIDRLHREWERTVAERKRLLEENARIKEEEYQRTKREIERRKLIWDASVAKCNERNQIQPEVFETTEPVIASFGHCRRPGFDRGCSAFYTTFGYDNNFEYVRRSWQNSGEHRRRAACVMVEHLGQWRNKKRDKRPKFGRGPHPEQKQPRGWKSQLSRSWTRKEHSDSKWSWCSELSLG